MKKIILSTTFIMSVLVLTGCGTTKYASQIEPTKVSSKKYSTYECKKLNNIYQKTGNALSLSEVQQNQIKLDENSAIATFGASSMLLGALEVSTVGKSKEEIISILKGEIIAIQDTRITKNCKVESQKIKLDGVHSTDTKVLKGLRYFAKLKESNNFVTVYKNLLKTIEVSNLNMEKKENEMWILNHAMYSQYYTDIELYERKLSFDLWMKPINSSFARHFIL